MIEYCKGRPASTAAEHCYHLEGTALLSNPPKYREMCCWCGTVRSKPQVVYQSWRKHGPYNPNWGNSVEILGSTLEQNM